MKFTQQLEQKRFEGFIGAIDLVDQQYGCAILRDRFEERALEEKRFAENFRFARERIGCVALGEPDPQQLLRVIPFVQRACRIEALIALQTDQARLEDLGENLRAFGFADARGPFQQERLLERQHEFERGREIFVHHVPASGESFGEIARVQALPDAASAETGSAANAERQPAQQK